MKIDIGVMIASPSRGFGRSGHRISDEAARFVFPLNQDFGYTPHARLPTLRRDRD
jgi:hypothetical protein